MLSTVTQFLQAHLAWILIALVAVATGYAMHRLAQAARRRRPGAPPIAGGGGPVETAPDPGLPVKRPRPRGDNGPKAS